MLSGRSQAWRIHDSSGTSSAARASDLQPARTAGIGDFSMRTVMGTIAFAATIAASGIASGGGPFGAGLFWPRIPAGNVDKPKVEICFVLDTTGSMGGLIAGAKSKIWAIANQVISAKPTPRVRFGLVTYRDRGD